MCGVYIDKLRAARAAAQGNSATTEIGMLRADGFEDHRELYRLITVAHSSVYLGVDGLLGTFTR